MSAPLETRLAAALQFARAELLRARHVQGVWTGELSSSALSTATAVCALATVAREAPSSRSKLEQTCLAGLNWLAAHANSDGGWGDTVASLSNISTTILGWAAFGSFPVASSAHEAAARQAENWLRLRIGGTDPDRLAAALLERYGEDRTFSVPILTMCAIAGRLGAGAEAWRHVLPLPFELAAFPHRWYAALGLPVVSYALPALIAIGQARHFRRPPRPGPFRWIRDATRAKTLRVLDRIQPSRGGFLEATPLTSFVVMSLAASGQVHHPVVRNGLEFLLRSRRADGSWAIDTNLATWLTTSAVTAFRQDPDFRFAPDEDRAISEWLLGQQSLTEHPYTHAAPGGWAWTDLPGGVPDADDTAGALLALRQLSPAPETVRAAERGIQWLLQLQNKDGGIPTFCRGWGKLPFDRSGPDLTAHALRAWRAWDEQMPPRLQRQIATASRRALQYLAQSGGPDGWLPLWFGNQHAPDESNRTYGNARVLIGVAEAGSACAEAVSSLSVPALEWLLRAQREDGSWSGGLDGPSSVEETAFAAEALAASLSVRGALPAESRPRVAEALRRGVEALTSRVEDGSWTQPSPIGFYFAKLWYDERLYPLIFTVAALSRAKRALG